MSRFTGNEGLSWIPGDIWQACGVMERVVHDFQISDRWGPVRRVSLTRFKPDLWTWLIVMRRGGSANGWLREEWSAEAAQDALLEMIRSATGFTYRANWRQVTENHWRAEFKLPGDG